MQLGTTQFSTAMYSSIKVADFVDGKFLEKESSCRFSGERHYSIPDNDNQY